MVFEFNISGNVGLLAGFAESIGGKIEKGMLQLPETLGSGYIQGFYFGPQLRMMIHRYELREELIFRRGRGKNDHLGITFHNVFQRPEDRNSVGRLPQNSRSLPSVRVTSSDIEFETSFPAETRINTIIIMVQIDHLKDLLNAARESPFLKNIIPVDKPYLYEEIISPEIQDVTTRIIEADVPEELKDFFFRLRTQELIYLFFTELCKRENKVTYPLNAADIKVMYQIRDKILSDLSIPPNLSELARSSGIGESKMKRLFRQIFGNSIYSYYQTLRIHEAAYLIKEEKLSVSEAGYRMGFTNLSHFTRVFESQIGIKPKKYSARTRHT